MTAHGEVCARCAKGWKKICKNGKFSESPGRFFGGRLAQLGERSVRNAEVGGSSPLPSTIFFRPKAKKLQNLNKARIKNDKQGNCGFGLQAEHYHLHGRKTRANITPWVLFTIFVFGPCEPLIPLVMYPAAQYNFFGVVLVTLSFGLMTILTMLVLIALSSKALDIFPKIRCYSGFPG